jgi:pyruvate,water dikinase
MLDTAQPAARCLTLEEISDQPVGGKARGLAELISMGLPVPAAFVIVGAGVEALPGDLAEHYAAIGGGSVAVRSSAIGEDGESASFAGQYETILNVHGEVALRQAVIDCIRSLHSLRVDAYNQARAHVDDARMCVVVQRMVDASSAGVLFTADPVSGRHDRLVVDAVEGLGEALVSGEATPDHYELDAANEVVVSDLAAESPILSRDQLLALAEAARVAVELHGAHLDMEWAIDRDGGIQWLQARPITTIGCDLNEGFTPIPADHVITRCNVGEMMPGPVCPLTFSTQGRAIEHGMQHMHVCYAGRPAITDEWTQINLFFGHMFINMTGGLESARAVSITNAEIMAQTLCGRPIPELRDPLEKKILPLRWWGTLKFLRYCLLASKVIAEFYRRFDGFRVDLKGNSSAMAQELESKFPWLLEADEVHLRSSAYSGLMEGVIQGIVSGKQRHADPEQAAALQAEAARLLAGAENVESAMMVEELDAVVDLIAADQSSAAAFTGAAAVEALEWLRTDSAGAAGRAFSAFLARHGHRGYRELCMREKAWREEPEQVVRTMQAAIASRLTGDYRPRKAPQLERNELNAALRLFLPAAHKAIRQREDTKSMLVEATYRLKVGYRHLGKLLVQEGHIDDEDLVYFFSRDELNDFCARPSAEAVERARQRQVAIGFQQQLEFEDVYIGFAEPRKREVFDADAHHLVGRPVSRGVVEGIARVALTLEEAADLQPGEILVSHITDIGWTPYFSLIAGLATDVGSAVSHGAVIAREYGLPAIVNLRNATRTVRSGERVRLDADKGILTRLSGDTGPAG